MPKHPQQRRIARARRLRAQGRSLADIAQAVGVDVSTVSRDLQRPAENGPPAPEAGNGRALVHGTYSEKRIGPLREKHMLELRATYEWADDRRLAVVADAAARLESAAMFIDLKGAVVRGPDLSVWPVSDRADRWARSLWAMLSQLEAEAREQQGKRGTSELARSLAAYSRDDDDEGGDGDCGDRSDVAAPVAVGNGSP